MTCAELDEMRCDVNVRCAPGIRGRDRPGMAGTDKVRRRTLSGRYGEASFGPRPAGVGRLRPVSSAAGAAIHLDGGVNARALWLQASVADL